MDTDTMIRELERVEEKHKHDKVFTGQLNVAQMAHDTRKRLEELKPYEDTGLTPEQIQEMKERNTPKKPHKNYEKFSGLWCKCGWYLGKKQCLDIKYCPNCGQAIDENLEGMEDE